MRARILSILNCFRISKVRVEVVRHRCTGRAREWRSLDTDAPTEGEHRDGDAQMHYVRVRTKIVIHRSVNEDEDNHRFAQLHQVWVRMGIVRHRYTKRG